MLSVVSPLLPIILPVLLCAALGVVWVRCKQPFDQEFVRRMVMWVGAPALIVSTLGSVEIAPAVLSEVLAASLLMLVWTALLGAAFCALAGLAIRNFLVPLTFGNFGNMGLPICLFAFGQQGLALALGVFLATMVCHFSLGVAVLNGSNAVRAVLRSPIIYAGALAALLVFCDWTLPATASNTLSILGGMSIPLMLITLGVSLGSLRVAVVGRAVILGVARLALGLSAGFLTVWSLELDGLVREVVLLQSAMPAAVFNYLLAVQYQREPATVAGMVVSSTLISFISIPVLLLYLNV
ncbi:AEC family transporter [Spongiibacter marinus]|uniref:AEC family transporter n=1 Tax=Spongiibacter marinus TaxID=354246 RepID=UPI003C46435A